MFLLVTGILKMTANQHFMLQLIYFHKNHKVY